MISGHNRAIVILKALIQNREHENLRKMNNEGSF